MAANVESMFYVREKPWHGLGTMVCEAPTSKDALIYSGLNWRVLQQDVYTEDGAPIPGFKVNLRSTDYAAFGIVSDRYKVVQNKVAMTPIRVVCQNTLNLALNSAKRIWTTKHTENVMSRVHEAWETLMLAEAYMSELGREIYDLSKIKLTDKKVMEFMQEFFPVTEDMPEVQKKNNLRLLNDMKQRYFDAPDLSHVGRNGYRFINAVSDFATHADPIRKTKNYNENLFLRTVEGNPMIDKAYQMVLATA